MQSLGGAALSAATKRHVKPQDNIPVGVPVVGSDEARATTAQPGKPVAWFGSAAALSPQHSRKGCVAAWVDPLPAPEKTHLSKHEAKKLLCQQEKSLNRKRDFVTFSSFACLFLSILTPGFFIISSALLFPIIGGYCFFALPLLLCAVPLLITASHKLDLVEMSLQTSLEGIAAQRKRLGIMHKR